ncbi:hypothetical protein DM02DRAFT_320578 [Periconia macrospinosa]|uniref:C6 finger domain protein n=1 Tax=Periconia macrospinosa TaxID=97972 RepID=A0A2V1D160_9PLEO|nr:hypothetical protein DM02DRAFT_320578 [Periconia macrospinosa]
MFMSNVVLTSGYRTLGSDFKLNDSFLTSKDGFAVCESSRACLTHCLTYQIAIDPAYAHLFDEYYSKSLRMFREEIAGPLDIGNSALYFGGIFMCIISFNRLLPWSNHLHALFSLIQSQIDPAVYCRDKKALEFMSALGFLDLPTHTIGRKTMYHQIWHAYCRGQSGVDEVSGLPFSLLDLLSAIGDLEIEGALLSWQPEAGRSAQRCLWEATRFAGVLCVRAKRAELHQSLPSNSTLGLSTEYLVESVLSSVKRCLACIPPELSHFKQALLYPLVMAAAQRDVLSEPMKEHICQTIQDLASERNFFHYRGVWRVVCEYWAGADESIESTARRLDIELALV